MSDLRSRLIHLAHAHPELRKEILPLLKTAHGPIVIKPDPDVMLFMINPDANNSKFYEMKVTPQPGGAALLHKAWGRLTDDPRARKEEAKEMYASVAAAQKAMQLHARSKTNKGYKPAPNREYPIGLGAAGFGWGGQAACPYIPELKTLHEKMKAIHGELDSFNITLAALARRKSAIAPKLADLVKAAEGPLAALGAYLDHQLSSCR